MHKKFESCREHGEWFQPSSELLDFIDVSCFHTLDAVYWAYFQVKTEGESYDDLVSLDQYVISKTIEDQVERSVKDFWKSDYFKAIDSY